MPEQTYRTLQEKEARLRAIKTELRVLTGLEDPADQDLAMQETLVHEYETIESEAAPLRARMERLNAVIDAADKPENRETPAEETPSARTETPAGRTESPTVFVRSGIDKDPFKDMSFEHLEGGYVLPDEMRARSAALIELDEKRSMITHDHAEVAYNRSQVLGHGKNAGGVAKHILLTGTPDYYDAFRSFLEDPLTVQDGVLLNMSEQGRYRAINLTNASGGYLLPYVLDPSIVLTNNASANPFRRVARIEQTTSNAWQGVNSAGVTAAWIAEATTAADMSPQVGQIQITPSKAVAWVLGSYEALDDTNFGEQLPVLLADAKDRLESAAFATGTGTNQPLGVLSALGTGSRVAPGATGTAFQPSTGTTGGNRDVLNLQAALPPRFRNSSGAAFLASIQQINQIRGLDIYGGGAFWANFLASTPGGLLGQPAYEASDLPTVTTGTSAASGTGSATLLFGDFRQYVIVDRVGVSMLYDPMLKGSTNAQLPTGQAGWYMFWRVGAAVATTAAFRYLTIS